MHTYIHITYTDVLSGLPKVYKKNEQLQMWIGIEHECHGQSQPCQCQSQGEDSVYRNFFIFIFIFTLLKAMRHYVSARHIASSGWLEIVGLCVCGRQWKKWTVWHGNTSKPPPLLASPTTALRCCHLEVHKIKVGAFTCLKCLLYARYAAAATREQPTTTITIATAIATARTAADAVISITITMLLVNATVLLAGWR